MKPRDVEALYKQYSKLRHKLLRDEKSRFAYKDSLTGKVVYDKAKVDDLKSYIDYQFIKLVKEYDPNSPVDFPAYITTKLKLRTKHSYIKRYFSHYYKTHDMNKDNDKLVSETLHDESLLNWQSEQEDSIMTKISKLDLSDIEKDIIDVLAQAPEVNPNSVTVPIYNSNKVVYQLLKNKYPQYTKKEFMNILANLRTRLQQALKNDK